MGGGEEIGDRGYGEDSSVTPGWALENMMWFLGALKADIRSLV